MSFLKRNKIKLLTVLILITAICLGGCGQSGSKGGGEYTCTISISCATVLDNMDNLKKEKAEIIPDDGYFLKPTEVSFDEGESVFDVLLRTCKENKLHFEYVDTPLYNSAFIEGIGNLYQFDCGTASGWMYSVNDWFPNYGTSRYKLKDGDVVCVVYTCDLGADVGGDYAATPATAG
ncbi:MAG: DUF4430 domain-containing protein [Oscillospiraceae bacterium]|nr:DUF4430 domain-containing protein [Oscillospiraceae bacterium]